MTVVSEGVGVESFTVFVESSLPRLVRFAGWVAGPAGDPQDLVHDALVRVGSRWDAVAAGPGDPEAYVRRAIVNGHVSRWRVRRREHLVDTVADRASGVPVEDPRYGPVWQAVRALPRGQRAVVALRFFEDMTVDESARALGVSQGTVKTQTHRALQTLRSTLNSDGAWIDEPSFVTLARAAAGLSPTLVPAAGAAGRVAQDVTSMRRRRTAVVGSAVAAAAAAVVAVLVWSPWSSIDRVQPVLPAPSVPESPAATTSPAATVPAPDPSAGGSATAADVTAATASSAAVTPRLDVTSYTFGMRRPSRPKRPMP